MIQEKRHEDRWSGPFAGNYKKLVYFNQSTQEYLAYDCLGTTKDRGWAWVGNSFQAKNMKVVFGIRKGFRIYRDGEENSSPFQPGPRPTARLPVMTASTGPSPLPANNNN